MYSKHERTQTSRNKCLNQEHFIIWYFVFRNIFYRCWALWMAVFQKRNLRRANSNFIFFPVLWPQPSRTAWPGSSAEPGAEARGEPGGRSRPAAARWRCVPRDARGKGGVRAALPVRVRPCLPERASAPAPQGSHACFGLGSFRGRRFQAHWRLPLQAHPACPRTPCLLHRLLFGGTGRRFSLDF